MKRHDAFNLIHQLKFKLILSYFNYFYHFNPDLSVNLHYYLLLYLLSKTRKYLYNFFINKVYFTIFFLLHNLSLKEDNLGAEHLY